LKKEIALLKKNKYSSALPVVFLLALLFCFSPGVFSQTNSYPRNYFRWPLNLKPEIVANLGELRPNHWHMGLDIRTAQKENQPVYAAATGYISKIRIERSGFGRCIWITHPNGFTTVYAHLNDYFPALEKYVTEQQYTQETWGMELELSPDKFPVSKGQLIAYSGNTGGSQGPHLHFEIRSTATDKCLNPLLFGMPLQDNVKPMLLKLALYDRGTSTYEGITRFFTLKNTDGGYVINKMPVLKTGATKVSFGLQAFDRMSGSMNQDGIYSAKLFFDGQPVTEFVLDSIGYAQTGYFNAHIDYKYNYNGGVFFQHLSKLPGERSGVYHTENGDGVISLTDDESHTVRVEVRDSYGNMSSLNFQIQHEDGFAKQERIKSSAQQFIPNYVNVLERPGFEMYIPEMCLYDTVRSFYDRTNSFPGNAVSALHQVNDPSVPVHGDLTVRIKPDKPVSEDWRNKIVIQRSYRGNSNVQKAEWNGEWLSAKFSDFGMFQAFADTEAPTINELGRADTVDLSASSRIIFQPGDNFGVRRFRAELDGQWLRFTNDKGRAYIYIFDERCPYGVHQLKVMVEDLVGNTTTKTWWFKKYPYKAPPKKVTKKRGSGKKVVAKKPAKKSVKKK
jgi:hypothetical protein